MAKVKPSLKSDEDSAVEFSKSTSESDQSPREDLFHEIDLAYPTYCASDSEFSDDERQSYDDVSSSTCNMVQSRSAKVQILPRAMNSRLGNSRVLTRKGRKRSIEDDENILEEELSRASHKHQSKNAINARINRIKKKKYMQSLEDSLDAYKAECQRWSNEYRQKEREVESLQNEVKYLKAVIRNESKLGALIKNLGQCANSSQLLPQTAASETKSVSLSFKGTNLSQTNNVNPNTQTCNNNNETVESDIFSDLLLSNSKKANDYSNFETNSSHSDLDLPSSEDMTFDSVFPSACDFFNFHLPESVEESDLFSPDTLRESTMDLDLSPSCDDVGICLHVSTTSGISLEFCPHCSKSPFSELQDVSLMV